MVNKKPIVLTIFERWSLAQIELFHQIWVTNTTLKLFITEVN